MLCGVWCGHYLSAHRLEFRSLHDSSLVHCQDPCSQSRHPSPLRQTSAKQRVRTMFRVLVILAVANLRGACTHAQNVPDSTPLLGRGANLVMVPTRIKSGSGEPVFGLTANDFILTDDGIEQKLSLQEGTDSQPLALVIVVQTGGAGGRRVDSYRRLGPLLDSIVGAVPHHVAVV